MRVYKDIYAFQVMDEIKSGKDVYVVDKAACDDPSAVTSIKEMSVGEFIEAISNSKKNRFSFFEIVEEDEEINE